MEFLRTQGRIIVNESGEEVILQGYGMGNWMNQEGFLFGSSVFSDSFKDGLVRAEKMDRGRSINQTIIELCGRAYAEQFWKRWHENYFGEADIKDLAQRGFNSVRLPLNAKVLLAEEPGIHFIEETFAYLDQIIDWCEENRLYVILDMHAAVGGQSMILCDDGVDNMPHLYTDEESWERTLILWEELARRYGERSVIAGYDLLNEPVALGSEYCDDLLRFYDEAIARIRKIDKKHILFLEGHRFASRNDIFRADMDPECHNWALAMHLYETHPDLGLMGPMLASSAELNVPIWLGETGGSSAYMAVAYEMMYENHIGVNIWCQKGVSDADAATLCTFEVPKDFGLVRAYAHEGGPKPGYEKSIRIFDELLENVKFENCQIKGHRADAILRRADVRVPAIGYDMLPGAGQSFQGSYPYCVFCGYRREDHMHLVYEPGFTPYESDRFSFAAMGRPPKYVDWIHLELMLEEGDFASYTIRHVESDVKVVLEYRAQADSELEVTVRGQKSTVALPASPKLRKVEAAVVPAGEDTAVKIRCAKGCAVLRMVTFQK